MIRLRLLPTLASRLALALIAASPALGQTPVGSAFTYQGQLTDNGSPANGAYSYHDGTAGTLKVAHCGNPACSAGNTIATVDDPPANLVGMHTSIAVGSDGLPVISHFDIGDHALKVAHCGNATCTAGNTIVTVDDPVDFVGQYTSIAVGADGRPVISYHDVTAGVLKVARCGNAAGTTGNTTSTVSPAGINSGKYTSIATGADGGPVISHFRSSVPTALLVSRCGNAACSAGNATTTVDSSGIVGLFTSIAIGADGVPVIGYHDSTLGALKVAKCGTRTCQ